MNYNNKTEEKTKDQLVKELIRLRMKVSELESLESKYRKSEKYLKYLSFHDKLTGLYNRAYFSEELKRLNTPRTLPLSIIIGDVNGLKLINDAFGHEKGDLLLKKIARILKKCFRKEDIIARWGGDEYIVILPNTINEVSVAIIDRAREACKNKSTVTLPLSISLGSATKNDPSKDVKEVIREAEDLMYRHKFIEHQSIRTSIISSLETVLKEKDYKDEKNLKYIRDLTNIFGHKLNLSDKKLRELNLLVTLHDIGKVAIADSILPKPEELTQEEWKVVKKHPEIGYQIAESSIEFSSIAEPILYHHEWWNGKGYPQGLKREQIPILARMIAIIDAYTAMITDRPYRKALSREQAIEELKEGAGVQFDPRLADIFISSIK